jgi:L-histidine Nalpha-methyltransferase
MGQVGTKDRFELVGTPPDHHEAEFADAVREGLSASPRHVPARFLYDARGSELFEQICTLPEYYPTRAEREILEDRADEIAAAIDREPTLVEFGSGSAEKTRHVIEALIARHGHLRYAPIDISRAALEASADGLLADHPELEMVGVWGEYARGLLTLERVTDSPLLVLWLGSSIGNLTHTEALAFLRDVRERLAPQDRLLIGVDLVKDPAVLEAAYDDAQGVTAAFTLNLIDRIARELGGDLRSEDFCYRSRWNPDEERIESHLEVVRAHTAHIPGAKLEVAFEVGDRIHTEYAHKYTPKSFAALAADAGFAVERNWTDGEARFRSCLLAPR